MTFLAAFVIAVSSSDDNDHDHEGNLAGGELNGDENVELEPLNLIFYSWELRLESKQLFSEKKKANNKKEFIFYYKKKYEKI